MTNPFDLEKQEKIYDDLTSFNEISSLSSNSSTNSENILVNCNENSHSYFNELSEYNYKRNKEILTKEVRKIFRTSVVNPENELNEKNTSSINVSGNIKFISTKRKKRGRKPKYIKIKTHESTDLDNLLSRIQVHFLSFIISLANDVLKAELGKDTPYNFKKFSYKIKYNVTYQFFNKLKNSTVEDILRMDVSPKYKHCDININSQILNEVFKLTEYAKLSNFFKMGYIDLFKHYYEGKILGNFVFEGKVINFSENTKPFQDLKKYEQIKSEFINLAKKVYIKEDNANNIKRSNLFITK